MLQKTIAENYNQIRGGLPADQILSTYRMYRDGNGILQVSSHLESQQLLNPRGQLIGFWDGTAHWLTTANIDLQKTWATLTRQFLTDIEMEVIPRIQFQGNWLSSLLEPWDDLDAVVTQFEEEDT